MDTRLFTAQLFGIAKTGNNFNIHLKGCYDISILKRWKFFIYLYKSCFGRLYETNKYHWLPADLELRKWEQNLKKPGEEGLSEVTPGLGPGWWQCGSVGRSLPRAKEMSTRL